MFQPTLYANQTFTLMKFNYHNQRSSRSRRGV